MLPGRSLAVEVERRGTADSVDDEALVLTARKVLCMAAMSAAVIDWQGQPPSNQPPPETRAFRLNSGRAFRGGHALRWRDFFLGACVLSVLEPQTSASFNCLSTLRLGLPIAPRRGATGTSNMLWLVPLITAVNQTANLAVLWRRENGT